MPSNHEVWETLKSISTSGGGGGGGVVTQSDQTALKATVFSTAATNFKAQSEVYMNGTAVTSTAPLAVATIPMTTSGYAWSSYNTVYTPATAGAVSASALRSVTTNVNMFIISNVSAGVRYVKVYNNTNPTLGGASPSTASLDIMVPAGSTISVPFQGVRFSNGVSVAVSTTAGINITTTAQASLGAGDIIFNLIST